MIKLFRTYNKVKDVFVRPKMKFYFGLWKNSSGLPFWRCGNIINLKKYGLGCLKPQIILPTWLSFYIFNYDVVYKWKYDDIRYEFPPQFTIVFFGLAFQIKLQAPLEDEYDMEDHYWESLLNYLYNPECKYDIKKTLIYCGEWGDLDEHNIHFQLRKSHIQEKYYEEYEIGIKEYNELKKIDKYENS